MFVDYNLQDKSLFREYLGGTRFNDNLCVSYRDSLSPVDDRIEFLTRLCTGKKIIHLGFCDHLPIVADKIRRGRWLHHRLCTVAERCVGVDIDESAVQEITTRCRLTDTYSADLTKGPILKVLKEVRWDYLVIGEVLEHVGNPVQFLSRISTRYGDCVSRIIITVPNAFRAGNFIGAFKSRESINSDHRFFFTPYTLTKVVDEAGLCAEQLLAAQFSETRGLKRYLKRIILRTLPLFNENLILVARMGTSGQESIGVPATCLENCDEHKQHQHSSLVLGEAHGREEPGCGPVMEASRITEKGLDRGRLHLVQSQAGSVQDHQSVRLDRLDIDR
jgi:hypothetical protein